DFRQRIGLVHELRQLRRTEKFANGGRDRLRIDQVVRHQVVGFSLSETLLDGTLNAYQAGAELVLGQLADTTYAAVAEVVDVVDFAATITQFHENLDDRQYVLVGQRHWSGQFFAAHAAIEL